MNLTIAACLSAFAIGGDLVEVVAGGAAVDGPVPLTCGVLARPAEAAVTEAVIWLEDPDRRPIPAVLHGRRDRRILHALLPAGSRGGGLRMLASPPKDLRALRILAGVASSGREAWIDTGTFRIELGPGAVVRSATESVHVFPDSGDGRWKQSHSCPLRAELFFEAATMEGRLTIAFMVSAHAGASRIELGLLVQASEAIALPEGAGLSFQSGVATPLRLGDATIEGNPWKDRTLTWSEGAWWEGDERTGSTARGVIGVGTGPDRWLALPTGREEGFESVVLSAGGQHAVFHWADPGTRLAAGDGRLFRAVLDEGPVPPSAPPLVIPRAPSPAAAALLPGLGAGPGTRDDPFEVAVADLVGSFLEDPARGLLLSGPGAGDWRMDRESFGNLEYDTVFGLLGWAASARAPAAFHQAQASLDHLLGQDLDRTGTGFFFEHRGAHRSGRTEAGHHWLEGPILLDLWLDDPLRARVLDEALARQIEAFSVMDPERQFPRCLGWGLRALAAGAGRSANREAWIREVRRWRRRILTAQARSGLLLLVRDADEAGLFRECPFVQGGIIAPALSLSNGVAPDREAAAAAARLARVLVDNAIYRTKDGWFLAETLVFDARAGRIAGRSGRAPGEESALFLSGVLRACPALAGDQAVAGLRNGLAGQLAATHRRFIGRELSLLLRALPGLRNR